MVDSVDQLHVALEFDRYALELQKFKGYWTRLLAMQRQARANPALLSRYQQSLEQGIARLKVLEQDRLEPDAAIRVIKAALEEYEQQRELLADEMRQRQRSVEEWAERWHPMLWQAFVDAVTVAIESPSHSQVQRVREAGTAILRAFSDASCLVEDTALLRKASSP